MAVASSGLVAEFVGCLAKNGAPGNNSDPTTTWTNRISSGGVGNAAAQGTWGWTPTTEGWAGSGSGSDPYRLFDDATTNYFDIASPPCLSNTKLFTWEAWIYGFTTISATRHVISDGQLTNASGATATFGLTSGGYIQMVQYDDTGASSTVAQSTGTLVNDGALHHIVATVNGTNVNLYVDGTNVKQLTITALGAITNTVSQISGRRRGSSSSSSGFDGGAVGTVREYNRDLSAAEVSANYSTGVAACSGGASTTSGVLVALLDAAKGVNLLGLTSPAVTQYLAPPLNPLTSDALVWTGAQRGGREGGQRAMTTNTWTTDNSKWDRLESYLIVGQAIAMRSFTSDEAAQANNARIRAYAIAAQVESWVRANRTAGGALEIEMEKMELALSNATVSSTNYKVATVTVNLRVHALI